MKRKKGILIAFEGGEGAGKSTQIRRLVAHLERNRVSHLLTRQPGGTRIGKSIRGLLLHKDGVKMNDRAELLLYEADRAQHVEEVVRPALKKGVVVISDRFADSSTVYQGICRGLGHREVERLNQFATAGLRPDLVIVLDIPPGLRKARLKSRGRRLDRMEREKAVFHGRVRRGFLWLAKNNSGRTKVLDGTKPANVLSAEISALVDNLRRG